MEEKRCASMDTAKPMQPGAKQVDGGGVGPLGTAADHGSCGRELVCAINWDEDRPGTTNLSLQ